MTQIQPQFSAEKTDNYGNSNLRTLNHFYFFFKFFAILAKLKILKKNYAR